MTQTETLSIDQIRQQDRDHAWHPLMQHSTLDNRDLMVIQEARGTTIVDGEGKSYLDAASGLWNVNVGYGREEIAEAVYRQIKELPFYPHSQINVPATQLATRLAQILPGDLQHIFYCNSGSEANETAFKIARQ